MTDRDRAQLGWRVDRGVKRRFEDYAERLYGDTPGHKGRACEEAMRVFMNEDRIADVESTLDAIADSLGVEKKKGKGTPMADGRYHVPEGKNPGDVADRQEAVVHHFLDMHEDGRLPEDDYGPFITQKMLKNAIEDVAGVGSQKTIKKYTEDITRNGPFKRHPERPGVWKVKV